MECIGYARKILGRALSAPVIQHNARNFKKCVKLRSMKSINPIFNAKIEISEKIVIMCVSNIDRYR